MPKLLIYVPRRRTEKLLNVDLRLRETVLTPRIIAQLQQQPHDLLSVLFNVEPARCQRRSITGRKPFRIPIVRTDQDSGLVFPEMSLWRQIESVGKNRWCGAFWQFHGLSVVPTVGWGLNSTYSFCFAGIERGCVVAVGMFGCKRARRSFMHGYDAMLEIVEPEAIICFGDPFPEMREEVLPELRYCIFVNTLGTKAEEPDVSLLRTNSEDTAGSSRDWEKHD